MSVCSFLKSNSWKKSTGIYLPWKNFQRGSFKYEKQLFKKLGKWLISFGKLFALNKNLALFMGGHYNKFVMITELNYILSTKDSNIYLLNLTKLFEYLSTSFDDTSLNNKFYTLYCHTYLEIQKSVSPKLACDCKKWPTSTPTHGKKRGRVRYATRLETKRRANRKSRPWINKRQL